MPPPYYAHSAASRVDAASARMVQHGVHGPRSLPHPHVRMPGTEDEPRVTSRQPSPTTTDGRSTWTMRAPTPPRSTSA